MSIVKIMLGTIYFVISIICIYLMNKDRKNKILYSIFGFILLLTSAILTFNL